MKLPVFVALLLACTASAPAQLKTPNANGVAMGAVHLTVRDVDANVSFFKLLGGTPVKNGSIQLMEFPGMYVELEKGEPSGPSIGSVVNHFGFYVKSMNDWLPKWQAAGIKIEPITRPTQLYMASPDDARIEILEEPTLATPIAGHHIHFASPDIPGMQAWYIKTFGAVAGTRGNFQTALLPGIELTLSGSRDPVAPTKGRAFAAIDFEVKNLKPFLTTLQAQGISVVEPYHQVPHTSVSEASIVDPWGTTIELSEGLGSTK
jgi:catechol 2,3-dioxygenase-like lactoylglutathione lyase family enzyme/predicted enzyme related to lactoylglutathione lyase